MRRVVVCLWLIAACTAEHTTLRSTALAADDTNSTGQAANLMQTLESWPNCRRTGTCDHCDITSPCEYCSSLELVGAVGWNPSVSFCTPEIDFFSLVDVVYFFFKFCFQRMHPKVPYCEITGKKERIQCEVDGKIHRSYQSCERVAGDDRRRFLIFEMFMVATAAFSIAGMKIRYAQIRRRIENRLKAQIGEV
eukprot:m.250309 g.250309  ORF g.250309 m.250309 type:complete len:193 (-) comp22638_c4_seq6:309-887(-)